MAIPWCCAYCQPPHPGLSLTTTCRAHSYPLKECSSGAGTLVHKQQYFLDRCACRCQPLLCANLHVCIDATIKCCCVNGLEVGAAPRHKYCQLLFFRTACSDSRRLRGPYPLSSGPSCRAVWAVRALVQDTKLLLPPKRDGHAHTCCCATLLKSPSILLTPVYFVITHCSARRARQHAHVQDAPLHLLGFPSGVLQNAPAPTVRFSRPQLTSGSVRAAVSGGGNLLQTLLFSTLLTGLTQACSQSCSSLALCDGR